MSKTIKSMDKLVLFAGVAKHLNFRAAAAELNIPVATLSRKVAELEAQLGLQLFQRTTRAVTLTRVGAQFFESIAQPLQALEQGILQTQEEQDEVSGQVRIATTSTLVLTNVLPVLPQLQRDYPKLKIELLVDPEVVDLRFEQIDLAIRAGTIQDTSLIARQLGTHVFARYTTPKWQGVADPPYIVYDSDFIDDGGAWVVVKDLNLIYQMVLAGCGEAYLPSVLCAEDERAGRLLRRDDFPHSAFNFYLVYPSRRYLSSSVRCVMEALLALAAHSQASGE